MEWNGQQLLDEIARRQTECLKRAAIYLVGELKTTLSVAAPRRRVLSRSGVEHYVATAKATAGAPPRKLSGRLRASVTWEMVDAETARVGTSIVYAKRHETGRHPFIQPTMQRVASELGEILAGRK